MQGKEASAPRKVAITMGLFSRDSGRNLETSAPASVPLTQVPLYTLYYLDET